MTGGTQEIDELPAKSKKYVDAGKPEIQIIKFDGQEAPGGRAGFRHRALRLAGEERGDQMNACLSGDAGRPKTACAACCPAGRPFRVAP